MTLNPLSMSRRAFSMKAGTPLTRSRSSMCRATYRSWTRAGSMRSAKSRTLEDTDRLVSTPMRWFRVSASQMSTKPG